MLLAFALCNIEQGGVLQERPQDPTDPTILPLVRIQLRTRQGVPEGRMHSYKKIGRCRASFEEGGVKRAEGGV